MKRDERCRQQSLMCDSARAVFVLLAGVERVCGHAVGLRSVTRIGVKHAVCFATLSSMCRCQGGIQLREIVTRCL